jgi:predicted RNA binding protein YcfA (HicA-like mRNA interferase family)
MTSRELLRKLRRLGARVVTGRGKGRKTFVPTGSGELGEGTLRTILRDLGIATDDLR